MSFRKTWNHGYSHSTKQDRNDAYHGSLARKAQPYNKNGVEEIWKAGV